MREALLIAKREYLERIRSKAFRISTVLIPLVFAAIFGMGAFSGNMARDPGTSWSRRMIQCWHNPHARNCCGCPQNRRCQGWPTERPRSSMWRCKPPLRKAIWRR